MKAFQPERTDLLINTDWGISKKKLPKEAATDQGLCLFMNRWVSFKEKEQLKSEKLAYSTIQTWAVVFQFVLPISVFFCFAFAYPKLDLEFGSITEMIIAFVGVPASIMLGWGFRHYCQWAHRALMGISAVLFVVILFLVLGSDALTTIIAPEPDATGKSLRARADLMMQLAVGFTIALLPLILLFNIYKRLYSRTARKIFNISIKMDNSEIIKEGPLQDVDMSTRPSWPYPSILFLYLVIIIITPFIGNPAGTILFFGTIAACIWASASRKQYERLKESYPSVTRSEYVTNMLVFPVVMPLLIFTIFSLLE